MGIIPENSQKSKGRKSRCWSVLLLLTTSTLWRSVLQFRDKLDRGKCPKGGDEESGYSSGQWMKMKSRSFFWSVKKLKLSFATLQTLIKKVLSRSFSSPSEEPLLERMTGQTSSALNITCSNSQHNLSIYVLKWQVLEKCFKRLQ